MEVGDGVSFQDGRISKGIAFDIIRHGKIIEIGEERISEFEGEIEISQMYVVDTVGGRAEVADWQIIDSSTVK